MITLSSFNFKKVLWRLIGVTLLGVILSIALTVFYALQIAHQFDELRSQELNSISDNQLDSISSNVQKLKISISNPFFAIGTLLATTPQTFLPLSRATGHAHQVINLSSDILKERKTKNVSFIQGAEQFAPVMSALNNLTLDLSQIHLGGLLTPYDRKIKPLRDKTYQAYEAGTSLAPLLEILPGLAGTDSPRKYLIAFQNSAEARGTGGILGAYAVMEFNKGKTTFSAFGSNVELKQLPDIPIKMPDEFVRLYNDDPGIWQNSNISPHFPYGAQIWLALWKKQFKDNLDGVITFDPISLSYLLEAIGPVQVNGDVIDSQNVVKITLSDLYRIYETDNNARKIFLVKIIQAVSQKIEQKKFISSQLISQIIYPINQHRILIYSANPKEQKIIEKSQIAGAISSKIDNEYRLVIQNTSGNKMDYYLKRKVKLETISCGSKRRTKVTFTLTNTATPQMNLPAYVAGRLDLNKPNGVANSYGTRAIFIPPKGSHLIAAQDLETGRKFGFPVKERGRSGVGVQIDLPAGGTHSYSLTFQGGSGKLKSHVQPLVIDQENIIIDKCWSK